MTRKGHSLVDQRGDTDRRIEDGRYTKLADFCLDHDDGGYTNRYVICDRGKPTGIAIVATGHSRMPQSHKQHISLRGGGYPTLRAAIYAYEDTNV
jgi:hypothetical protein